MRVAADIDAEARSLAGAAIQAGRNVLLHLLQTSKTGRSGLTDPAASQILASAPQHVVVVVDCCQLRCSRERVRQLLRGGFMVAITGSKFFGGPTFSGALLLPPRILGRLRQLALPAGLADYSSRLDWPGDLRAKARVPWASEANLGLGLRWVAALDEMERYFAAPSDLRRRALAFFENETRKRANCMAHLREVSDDADLSGPKSSGILSFVMAHPDGALFSWGETASIHARLRTPCDPAFADHPARQQIFHLGQPVAIGQKTALRICASAPIINETVERIQEGDSLQAAFAPWGRKLDALFVKWTRLMAEASAQRGAVHSQRRERRP